VESSRVAPSAQGGLAPVVRSVVEGTFGEGTVGAVLVAVAETFAAFRGRARATHPGDEVGAGLVQIGAPAARDAVVFELARHVVPEIPLRRQPFGSPDHAAPPDRLRSVAWVRTRGARPGPASRTSPKQLQKSDLQQIP